jgi:hypothetical protein
MKFFTAILRLEKMSPIFKQLTDIVRQYLDMIREAGHPPKQGPGLNNYSTGRKKWKKMKKNNHIKNVGLCFKQSSWKKKKGTGNKPMYLPPPLG